MDDDRSNAGTAETCRSLGVDPDRLFDALADSRRRHVLGLLDSPDEPVPLADLARQIAARESDCDASDVPVEDAKSVYTSLVHSHVPKMVDADLVAFDAEASTVALTDAGECVLESPVVETGE